MPVSAAVSHQIAALSQSIFAIEEDIHQHGMAEDSRTLAVLCFTILAADEVCFASHLSPLTLRQLQEPASNERWRSTEAARQIPCLPSASPPKLIPDDGPAFGGNIYPSRQRYLAFTCQVAAVHRDRNNRQGSSIWVGTFRPATSSLALRGAGPSLALCVP
ncbi:hypothetical protein VTI74DRAFT_7114 [Chaetomium olivicolor]